MWIHLKLKAAQARHWWLVWRLAWNGWTAAEVIALEARVAAQVKARMAEEGRNG